MCCVTSTYMTQKDSFVHTFIFSYCYILDRFRTEMRLHPGWGCHLTAVHQCTFTHSNFNFSIVSSKCVFGRKSKTLDKSSHIQSLKLRNKAGSMELRGDISIYSNCWVSRITMVAFPATCSCVIYKFTLDQQYKKQKQNDLTTVFQNILRLNEAINEEKVMQCSIKDVMNTCNMILSNVLNK